MGPEMTPYLCEEMLVEHRSPSSSNDSRFRSSSAATSGGGGDDVGGGGGKTGSSSSTSPPEGGATRASVGGVSLGELRLRSSGLSCSLGDSRAAPAGSCSLILMFVSEWDCCMWDLGG